MKQTVAYLVLIGLACSCLGFQTIVVKHKAATGTWSLVQDVLLSNAKPSTATMTVAAGHLLVVLADLDGDGTAAEPISTVTSTFCSGSWVIPAGVSTFNAAGGTVAGAYCITSAAQTGVTMSVNYTGAHVFNFFTRVLEYSWSGSTVTVDGTPSSTNVSVAVSPLPGQAITITGAKDTCLQWTRGNKNVTAVSGTYTNPADLGTTTPNGWAGSINTNTGAAPNWTVAAAATGSVAGMCFSGT